MAEEEPTEETPKVPWGLTIVVAMGLAAVLTLLVLILGAPWLSNLWFNYAWPSDKGNGPEALQQTILYAAIAVLLIPPVRAFLKREFHKVHQKLEAGHAELKDHLERHEKLMHHIIVNSPMDNHVPGIIDEHQPHEPE